MSSSYQNVFQCECKPGHDFYSLEEFNQHFSSMYHRYYECSCKSLFQEYVKMQTDLKKLKQERDMWKHLYEEEFMKDTSL